MYNTLNGFSDKGLFANYRIAVVIMRALPAMPDWIVKRSANAKNKSVTTNMINENLNSLGKNLPKRQPTMKVRNITYSLF